MTETKQFEDVALIEDDDPTPFDGDRELDWDDSIENDSTFVLLPAGDYDFEVVNFERGRHNGSEKLPPCNKAIVDIKIEGPEGSTIIKHHLFLHSRTEGMLCAFFVGIGQRKRGEKLRMDWSTVIGSKGRAKVAVEEYIGRNGDRLKSNKIKKFYEPTDAEAVQAQKTFVPGAW